MKRKYAVLVVLAAIFASVASGCYSSHGYTASTYYHHTWRGY
jgi:hypothetical protein